MPRRKKQRGPERALNIDDSQKHMRKVLSDLYTKPFKRWLDKLAITYMKLNKPTGLALAYKGHLVHPANSNPLRWPSFEQSEFHLNQMRTFVADAPDLEERLDEIVLNIAELRKEFQMTELFLGGLYSMTPSVAQLTPLIGEQLAEELGSKSVKCSEFLLPDLEQYLKRWDYLTDALVQRIVYNMIGG